MEIKGCLDCPFNSHSYNSWDEDINTCELLLYNRNKERMRTRGNYFIDFYKNGNVKSKNKKTLDVCPLLKEELCLKLEQI